MDVGDVLTVVLILVVLGVPTVYGLIRALATQQTAWAIAIFAGWIVALGWLVGLIFLLGPDRKRRTAAR